jgi:Flp pilus assembly pilin Flp
VLKLFAYGQILATEAFETVHKVRRREEGQTMAEYAVVLALITLAVVGVILALSTNIKGALQKVADTIKTV